MEKFGGPILQKYANINRKGKESILKEDVVEFKGFPEAIKDRFISAAVFDEKSLQEIDERILSRLKKLESECGVEFFLASRDFPLHSTIMEGEYKGNDDTEKDELFKELADSLPVEIQGLQIPYNYVLIDKGNVLLVAQNIPEQISAARTSLKEFYAESGLNPLLLENILHCSLARLKKIPENFEPDKYIKELIDIRHTLSNPNYGDPIVLTVNKVVRGNSYDFVNSEPI